jgi:hypothetical protein
LTEKKEEKMTEKKDKMINLKGANSTMKLGFLIYSVMVVAFILITFTKEILTMITG